MRANECNGDVTTIVDTERHAACARMMQMHVESKTHLSGYFLFSSRERMWALTALSAISLFMNIKDLIFPGSELQFEDVKFRTFAMLWKGPQPLS